MELLGGKWKTVILARLKERPLRYGELRTLIPRLSDKVLTQRLVDLQEQGFVVRESAEGDAPRYRLTTESESLRPLLQQLYEWGETQAKQLDVTFTTGPERVHPGPADA